MRSGTLPVHQIVGMGEAYRIEKKKWRQRSLVSELYAIAYIMA